MISCVMLCTWPKRAAFVREALVSYDLQTYPRRELVVVNDGATLAPGRADVRVLNVPAGMTIGEKRNVGLANAAGVWVATWDDDDFSFPDRLDHLVALADGAGASVARSGVMWVTDERMRIHALTPSPSYPTAVVWRADAIAAGGYPPISYAEDGELSARMRVRGMAEVVSMTPVYAHRRHGDNVTATRENLADNVRRSLPQALAQIPAAQAQLDSWRAWPCDTLIVPA